MKKLGLMLCLLLSVFTFAACGSKNTATYDEDEMKTAVDFVIYYLTQTTGEAKDEILELDPESSSAASLEATLYEYYHMKFEVFAEVLESYIESEEELGTYLGTVTYTEDGYPVVLDEYTITESNKEVTYTVHSKFSEHDADLEFVFNANGKLSTVTINTNYSTGEILQKAGLNTLLGMGTVFAVLTLIVGIISCFTFIPKIEAAFKKNKQTQAVSAPVESAPAAVAEPAEAVEETDDLELVAVITAAIAASESAPADGFVVRSIKRRKTNRW